MSEIIKFTSSIGGYKKIEVDEYIQKIHDELENFKVKYDEILRLKNESDLDKERIAKIFIRAQEKAEVIVQEAEKETSLKRKIIEDEIDKNKKILKLLKEEVESYKNKINKLFSDFDNELTAKEGVGEDKNKKNEGLDMEFDRIDDDFKIDDDFETI